MLLILSFSNCKIKWAFLERKYNMSLISASAPTEEDPVELMLKKTGCIELHYKVQECIAETGDWRRCQDQVKEFRACMIKYTEDQNKKYSHVK